MPQRAEIDDKKAAICSLDPAGFNRVFHSHVAVAHNAESRLNILAVSHCVVVVSLPVEQLSSMTQPARQPSRRLLAAATAERAGIERGRQRLFSQRQKLQEKLDRLDAELAELDERAKLIDRLAPQNGSDTPARTSQHRPADSAAKLLRGPAIRHAAVKVLLADPRRPQALHYRDWYSRVEQQGYAVAGKDPLAVFLTQLSRSPVVRRGTQSGVYELNLAAVDNLRCRLEERRLELRNLVAASANSSDLNGIRSQRTAVNHEIGKLENALQEAELLLASDPPDLAAAG